MGYMADSPGRPKKTLAPTAYEEAFRKRVRAARALYTEEPKEMARALGVREDTYYRYETRTMLPHHLIPRFCELTGVTVEFLINGPRPGQPAHTGITARE
jgi:DNA-binding XRE family transcriptional regulator